MKISLIATVLNAEEHVGAFLASIAAQTRAPDEIVIVDGGSTDGTVAALRAADGITLVEEPGANISRGRNTAIARTAHEAIAVADADCVYGPGWLAALAAPLEDGADVSMGWTEPIVGSVLSACVSSLGLPLSPEEVDPATFMPSARSVAFRRDTIEAVGGYPEWLAIGEDMWVNHRWRERPFDLRFAPEAVAGWHPRDSLGAIWTQYMKYARGDGQAGLYPERHALRFAVYGGLLAGLASRRTWPKLLAASGAAAYARTPVRRARARVTSPRDRAAATVLTPALLAFTDVAKMTGYALGLADRLTGRVHPS
jgi:glycosyltransferase involved in cell wall biosynthesis